MDVTFSSRYDPYIINSSGKRINQWEIKNERLARFTNSNAALGLNISESLFNKKTEDKKEQENKEDDFIRFLGI